MLYFSLQNARPERESGLTGSWSERSRIMLGSFSDWPRIGNDVSAVFSKFLSDFG